MVFAYETCLANPAYLIHCSDSYSFISTTQNIEALLQKLFTHALYSASSSEEKHFKIQASN